MKSSSKKEIWNYNYHSLKEFFQKNKGDLV